VWLAAAACHGAVPLQKVFDCMPGTALVGGTRLTAGGGELRAEGRDRFGRQWSWRSPIELRCAVFQGDLDANGARDLVLLMSTRFTALLFDRHGQPVPWTTEGDFTGEGGLPALVDLNRDRRAELVQTIEFENYTLAVLYEARRARWRQVRGRFAGRRYPLVNGSPPSRPPFIPDESNAWPADQKPATLERVHYPWMHLADKRRCKLPALILLQSGSRIAFAPGDDAATLARLRDAELPLYLAGRREPGVCSPAYVWAGK